MLAARASLPASSARAFAELSAIAPEGLIPTPGRGAGHVARQLVRAARVAAGARALTGPDVSEAFEQVAASALRIASTADALDPGATARATRRGVATVRGLVGATIDRDARWEAFRLGTYLPRAGWVAALVRASAEVAPRVPEGMWDVAAAVASVDPGDGVVPNRLLSDRRSVGSVAFAISEVESAILAMARDGAIGGGALPLAREARGRLRAAAATTSPAHVDEFLDALGALSALVDPSVAGPGQRRDPSAA